jgi:hypothetical protein
MIELENFVYLIPSVRGVMIQKEQVQPYYGEFCPITMIEATKLSILRETSATRLQATSFVDDRQSGSHQIHVVGPHPETLLTKFQNFLTEEDR